MAEFLVIHIPGDVEPMERGERFEDPLDKALRKAGKVGKCVGGGTAFEMEPEFRITGCDIEVEVADLARAMPVIRDTLVAASAPPGTTATHADTEKVLLRLTKSGVKEFAPSSRPAKKRFRDSCSWEPGEVLAYRLTRDRYVLLHVYGFGGLGPVLWVPEWCGADVPSAGTIRDLIRRKPEFYRLGSVFEAWRQDEADRDDRKVIRTGVVIPPPKNGLRGWFPGIVEVRLWPVFERMLKEVFGLVTVTPAVRLNHDMGLVTAVAHLAVWHPDEAPTAAGAKRLFYAHASGFRRKHPNRQPQPVTDELRAFVTELKARFADDDVWQGTFAAKEGFVIMPIARKKLARVKPVAVKLARRHGLACYDPERGLLARAKPVTA
jgi:hypothetical protein